jgi:hypothetical protein
MVKTPRAQLFESGGPCVFLWSPRPTRQGLQQCRTLRAVLLPAISERTDHYSNFISAPLLSLLDTDNRSIRRVSELLQYCYLAQETFFERIPTPSRNFFQGIYLPARKIAVLLRQPLTRFAEIVAQTVASLAPMAPSLHRIIAR